MIKKIGLTILTIAVSLFILTGCSNQARTNYNNAGSDLVGAARDTGQAIHDDLHHTKQDEADENITERVKDEILSASDIQTFDLGVDTRDMTVTLRGKVGSEEQNQSAEHIARRIAGSKYSVNDLLTVRSND